MESQVNALETRALALKRFFKNDDRRRSLFEIKISFGERVDEGRPNIEKDAQNLPKLCAENYKIFEQVLDKV